MTNQPESAPQPLLPGSFDRDPQGEPCLLGSRCVRCGEHFFPRRQVCPRCKEMSTEPVRLSRVGRLYSFTVCHIAPSGWKAPYLQAFVELPEGLRVFTLISDEVQPAADALEVGMPMEVVVEPARTAEPGAHYVSYKFRPVKEGGRR